MERRTFVQLSAYTALALTLPSLNGCNTDSKEKVISQPLFFSHLADAKTIRESGLAYRKLKPSEDSQATLVSVLSGNDQSNDRDAIRDRLDEQVKQDFKTGKIVTLTGWVLSETEARQCALFSILNS